MPSRSSWMAVLAVTLLAGTDAFAAGNAVLGGNTGFAINNSGPISLVATPISYLNRSVAQGRRSISLRVGQPMLCADFAPAPAGASNPVGLVLTDPNNETLPPMYGGITSFDFVTNGSSNSQFKVAAGSQLACCIMLPAANASCIQGTNGGAIIEVLHDDGFESVSASSPGAAKGTVSDVRVLIAGPSAVGPGSVLTYTIAVVNIGADAVNGVRLRDWYPKSSGGFAGAFSPGSWSCTPSGGSNCGVGSGSGNISIDNISLGVGGNVVYTVNRQMSAGAPNGAQYAVSAAAFTQPSGNEVSLGNNQAMLAGTVQNSVPPVISDIGSQPQTGIFLEDQATTAIAFTASDNDSVLTTSSFSCQSQNTALIDGGDCQFAGSEPNFTVTMTPNADANGSSLMTITVTDGFSQASDNFNLTISPLNDAPSFNIGANITRPIGTVGIQQVNNFIASIATGPANESGQGFTARTVTVLQGSSSIFSVSGEPNINYSGSAPNETGNLAFSLNGTPGSAIIRVRMQDNGGTANGGDDDFERDFTITVTGIE